MTSRCCIAWTVSLLAHGVAALLAAAAVARSLAPDRPTLPGQRGAQVELVASWSEDAGSVQSEPPEVRVVVMPAAVQIDRHTYHQASTDVSHPTPAETALAARVMAGPPQLPPRRSPDVSSAAVAPAAPAVQRAARAADLPTEAQHAPAAAPVVFGHADQTPPRPLANLPPVYPEQAVAARWQGVTLLRVHVVADGAAADVEVLSSSGHAVLDAAAVRAVRTWRFEPARHNGRPVAAAVRLPVRFQLD